MENTRKTILQWAELGHIGEQDVDKALDLAQASPSSDQWFHFLRHFLVVSGVLSSAVGVIFFFAYNWAALDHIFKFALVESLLLVSAFAYLLLDSGKVASTAALMGMTLLTGALFALIGQSYQTGADHWLLFAIWAALILPWACLARSSALWVLWLLLCNISLFSYLSINRGFFGLFFENTIALWLFLGLNTLAAVVFEFASDSRSRLGSTLKYHPWIASSTAARCAVLGAGTSVTWIAIDAAFEIGNSPWPNLPLYFLWIGGCLCIYRWKFNDLRIVAACLLSIILVLTSVLAEMLSDSFDEGSYLLVALAIVAMSTAAGIWLKKQLLEIHQSNPEGM
jgi:uncharacterized membrane protein